MSALTHRRTIPQQVQRYGWGSRGHAAASARPATGNAADPDRLRPFLPAVGRTQVVITSTDQAFTELGEMVSVPVFSRSESLRYLQARTGLVGQEDADSVAEAVGDLPLALSQVAATIRRRQLSYRTYLERLRSVQVRDLLGAVPGGDYPQATAAALLLSVQVTEASDASGLTSQLLRVVAVLSPHGVRRDLLARLSTPDGSGGDELGLVDRVLETCTAGSVLAWSVAGEAVLMHRLLGRVLRERDQADERWADTVTAALNLLEPCLFPRDQALARREEGTQLTAQVEALWDAAGTNTTAELRLRLLRARSWAVQQLLATADFSRAIAIGRRLLTTYDETLGTGHPDTLAAQADLAYAYLSTGQLGRAIPLHEQALAGRERTLGPDHPDTLESRDHLAQAFMQTGQLDRAVPLFQQVLADCERTMGHDHRDTFSSRNNLAAIYWSVGRREEAIALDEQTLAGRERTLGPDHPDTLTSRSNLAVDYQGAGRLDEAIALDEQALAGRERILGHDHPRTLSSRNNLAHDYRLAGRLDEAIPLHEQVVLDSEKIMGHNHPSALAFRDNLAEAYVSAGRLDEAISLHEQTLAEREQIQGREHPDTLRSQEHVAEAYALAGRLDEAIALHRQTLARREQILGHDHPDTLISRDHLERTRARTRAT
jgi:tetratricopeptide (TPR) repeat protein